MKSFYNAVQEARFLDIDDLYRRKSEISEIFNTFDLETKQIYKWYFFCELSLIKNPLKSLLWDYIIGIREAEMILELSLEYRRLLNRRKEIDSEYFCDM